MKRITFLLILNLTLLTQYSFAQKKLQCGLLTNFSLLPISKLYKPSESDINQLNSINNELKVTSYMNKTINEGTRKIIVSLFTTGTYETFIYQINGSTHSFVNQKTIKKNGIIFSCYNFKFSEKMISRIVYNEPQLTLCVVFDVLTSEVISDYNNLNNEIINRISFTKKN